MIGTRRQPSKLNEIQPDRWLAAYTTELINILNVIGLLGELEPRQADLLERVCVGTTLSLDDLNAGGCSVVARQAEAEDLNSRRARKL